MDFDYQRFKDVEMLKQQERIRGLQILALKPVVPQTSTQDSTIRKIPPIKPRRSLKVPKTHREGVAIPAKPNSDENGTIVKKMSPVLTLGGPGPLEPLSPSLRAHALLWFERTQLPRLRRPGHTLPPWLHGFATRREAEELLKDKQQGCFLIRLSESKIGFVLSYRGKDKCRHFIIEEDPDSRRGRYLITGEESRHCDLNELVSYYTRNPVGPFNEMLSTPCEQSRETFMDTVKRGMHGDGGEVTPKEASVSSKATCNPDAVQMPEISASPASNTDRMPEYAAVVRKKLQKSNSLPEGHLGKLIEVKVLIDPPEDDGAEPGMSCAGAACDGQADHNRAQYARVNKPPRTLPPVDASPYVNVSSPPGQQGAMASTTDTVTNQAGSAGDPGYWKLEPLHTYEETLQPVQQDEAEIDFYAIGQRREAERRENAKDNWNHLYSEVNVRGTKQSPSHVPLPPRVAPNLPSRPPPRASNAPPRPERNVQQSGDPLLSFLPFQHGVFQQPFSDRRLTNDHGASIYEQIQERPTSLRPLLPPPNAKP
ncbi:hypothetical protein DPEC_G00203110 [Dallia pectoralis]|uniref:Uncharacterized protein n=1 Tax=Dallia pectoralis TaxID=75939 RepID=A0ACC2G9E7_DALPE|nr:hypothetical protein DPEC_G00203110 [Dallia pectoralis]